MQPNQVAHNAVEDVGLVGIKFQRSMVAGNGIRVPSDFFIQLCQGNKHLEYEGEIEKRKFWWSYLGVGFDVQRFE
jgi:hypothetical protein